MLVEQLERHFQLACEPLNPLALFENKASTKRYKNMDRHVFGIAAGMAVSGLKWQGVKHVASN
jgi:type IV pilus assembly protein PilM